MIAFTLIICAVGCSLLAVLLVLQGKRMSANWLASAINVCLAVWAIAILYFIQADTVNQARLSSIIYYVIAAIFVALLALFAYVFPRNNSKPPRIVTVFTIIACLAIVLSIIFVPSFITGTFFIGNSNYIKVDKPSYIIYVVYFVFFFLLGSIVMAKKFLLGNHRLRIQSGIYLFGVLAMAIPGFITNLLLPYYQNYTLIWVGPAMASVFLLVMSYGMTRHSLFDIRLAAVRSLAYILALTTLASAYYGLAILFSSVFLGTSYATNQSPISIVLAVGMVFAFQPTKRLFDRLTNRIFYRDNYDTGVFLTQLNKIFTSTTDLRDLLQQSSTKIAQTLKSDQAFFVIRRQNNGVMSVGTIRHSRLPQGDMDTLDAYTTRYSDGAIVAGELALSGAEDEIRKLMISHKIELALPLVQTKEHVGYLCLGSQKSGGFSRRDTNVLRMVSDELTIAIQNALVVQEIKDLNDTLQQRVDQATKELRVTNTTLRRLDEAKDEFVNMASHQLRTPLTSVKGYISMVLEGDAGQVNATQKKLLEEAFSSSERMVHLIGDFLDVSRLQTGKFVIEAQPVDLAKVVKQELDSLGPNASSRGLRFDYKISKDLPNINLDEGKIRQVIMNMCDNAIYYSQEGKVIYVNLEFENSMVVFTVKDSGIGVPKIEQNNLFTKFYRASNARKQRPDGTGVGLYLAKKVIIAHGGSIVFESIEGKGSTFGFRLPINYSSTTDNAN